LPFRRIQLDPLASTARFAARRSGFRRRLLDGAAFPGTGELPGMREVIALKRVALKAEPARSAGSGNGMGAKE
jgi:hypothetical protein